MNLSGKRTFPIHVIDSITEALDLPPGALYQFYLGECFSNDKWVKHRIEEFLYHCLKLRLTELTNQLLSILLLEPTNHLDAIFHVVQRLFADQLFDDALPLVQAIIAHDPNRHGQRLAICYFYRFFIIRSKGMDKGYEALVQMLEYIIFMPRDIQLEAYLRIITFFHAREDWEFVTEYAKKLEDLAGEGKYYGEALLYQAIAAKESGEYELALQITEIYGQINDYYATVAEGNKMMIKIAQGQFDLIESALDFLENKWNDRYTSMPHILEACVKSQQWDKVDSFLQRFQRDIQILYSERNPFVQKLLLHFCYYFAIYLNATGKEKSAVESIAKAILLAQKLGIPHRLRECLWLYREYRRHATAEIRERYEATFQEWAAKHAIIW